MLEDIENTCFAPLSTKEHLGIFSDSISTNITAGKQNTYLKILCSSLISDNNVAYLS